VLGVFFLKKKKEKVFGFTLLEEFGFLKRKRTAIYFGFNNLIPCECSLSPSKNMCTYQKREQFIAHPQKIFIKIFFKKKNRII
jgi:hypothetical protein